MLIPKKAKLRSKEFPKDGIGLKRSIYIKFDHIYMENVIKQINVK